MKKLIVVLFTMGLATGVFAQKVIRGGGVRVISRPVIAVGAYSPFYGYGYGSFWGTPFGYPYYGYHNAYNRPTKLDLQIADIKNDYQQKISSAKSDKSVARSERKAIVRDLKHERDQQIIEAQRDYYKLK
jgi:hypothetical protein